MSSVTDNILPNPGNFRNVAQVYADQISLLRRTTNAIMDVVQKASGSVLFDPSNDSLSRLPGLEEIQETQTRIVDLLVLAALGQSIDMEEFRDYAKLLVGLYGKLDMIKKFKDSGIKDQALRDLEGVWQKGNDMMQVQEFFKGANASIANAAEFCGISIGPLPVF